MSNDNEGDSEDIGHADTEPPREQEPLADAPCDGEGCTERWEWKLEHQPSYAGPLYLCDSCCKMRMGHGTAKNRSVLPH